ncbi:MFS transporter [Pseudomaricurvus sp. HS19]|nr:MFS transporter [Pseudomaricurvus sp. HS19]
MSPFLQALEVSVSGFSPSFERRAVVSLASLYAFRMLGLFMVLPVLVLYGGDYEGATPALLGLALGAYGFSQALLQIPFGMLSDRLGRKPIIALGLLIFAAGSVVAATADSVYGLILGRCLQGGGAIASAIMALVADLTNDASRTKAMASIGASIGISFSVALVLGPLLAGFGGLPLLFWATAGLALAGLWILLRLVPSPVGAAGGHREAGAVPQLFVSTLLNRELLRLNVGIFTLHFVLMACFLVLPGILESSIGIARTDHWMVYLPLLLLAFIAMVPFIIIAEKRQKMKPVFLGAIALLGLSLAGMSHWQQPVLFLLLLFTFFIGFNLLEATLPSLMSKMAPAGGKGTASGIYATWQFLGAFAGGACGGWLQQHYGGSTVWLVGAGLIACWWLLASFMPPPRHLASVQVPLTAAAMPFASARLAALPGVVEVVLIREECAAYLKVDPRHFHPESAASIDWAAEAV